MSGFADLEFGTVARANAIEALLSPSAAPAKHLDELTRTPRSGWPLSKPQGVGNSHENLAVTLERLQEPPSLSSEAVEADGLPFDAAELEETERTHAEIAQLVDDVTTEISQAHGTTLTNQRRAHDIKLVKSHLTLNEPSEEHRPTGILCQASAAEHASPIEAVLQQKKPTLTCGATRPRTHAKKQRGAISGAFRIFQVARAITRTHAKLTRAYRSIRA